MNRLNMYTKNVMDNEYIAFQLDYSLLIRSAEQGQVYGVAVKKTDSCGNVEIESAEGLTDDREEAEVFLSRLAEGLALPVELLALCDDYLSEKES